MDSPTAQAARSLDLAVLVEVHERLELDGCWA